jgi:hypothetical protein
LKVCFERRKSKNQLDFVEKIRIKEMIFDLLFSEKL